MLGYILHTYLSMKMEQSVPKSRHINSDTGELPRRKHTTFRTRRKFEIKNIFIAYFLKIHFNKVFPCLSSFP